MHKLSRKQSIAVFIGIMVTGFILFGGQFLNLFFQGQSTHEVSVSAPSRSGVSVQNIVVGKGDVAEKGDIVTVNYVGMLVDGKVFDSSIDRKIPFTFKLGVGQVIRGWDEGVVGMKVGGQRKLTIGPDFGYGSQTVGTIPPNSTLVFEVELLGVDKPTQ